MNKFMNSFEGAYMSAKATVATVQWLRLLKIAISVTVSAMLTFVVAGTMFEEASMFTVSLIPAPDKDALGGMEISMSETADFAEPTIVLSAEGVDNMTNISYTWLPTGLDSTDGAHNGENYMAYTFYVKNVGEGPGVLREIINVDSALLGADEAIRVRVYRNGDITTYAKMGADGMPETGTTPFESDEVVFSNDIPDVQPGQIIKYTLVIWLEGDDPECLDNIKGGNVKMSMTFEVGETPQA